MTSSEAVASICDHTCRSRNGLKLSMASCQKRKEKAEERRNKHGNPYWECIDCEGAIPIDVKPEREPRADACKVCGRTPDETRFYPSRIDRCAECIKAAKRKWAAENKSWTNIKEELEEVAIPLKNEMSKLEDFEAPAEAKTVTCKACGAQFVPWQNGGVLIKTKCQDCVKGARKLGWETNLGCSYILRVNFSEDKELLERLGALAKRERRTVDQQVLVILEQILQEETR